MPKLSDSMADAVILRWLKSPGDAFERGEALIEVETDKATVIYEAEWDGTLDSILVPEGATSRSASRSRPSRTATARRAPRARPPSRDRAGGTPADAGRRRDAARAETAPARPATPVARRAAVELGVSLHGLTAPGRAAGSRSTTSREPRPRRARRPAPPDAVSGRVRSSVSSRRRRRRRSRAG